VKRILGDTKVRLGRSLVSVCIESEHLASIVDGKKGEEISHVLLEILRWVREGKPKSETDMTELALKTAAIALRVTPLAVSHLIHHARHFDPDSALEGILLPWLKEQKNRPHAQGQNSSAGKRPSVSRRASEATIRPLEEVCCESSSA
jgi:hypothetical protein